LKSKKKDVGDHAFFKDEKGFKIQRMYDIFFQIKAQLSLKNAWL